MSGLMRTEIGSGQKPMRVRNNFDYLITGNQEINNSRD